MVMALNVDYVHDKIVMGKKIVFSTGDFPQIQFRMDICCNRRHVLVALLKELRARSKTRRLKVVEVGASWGITAFHMLNADSNLEYLGMDPYPYNTDADRFTPIPRWLPRAQATAKRIVESFGSWIFQNTSVNIAKRVPDNSLDLIFVDGLHDDTVQTDIRSWLPKLRPGGYFAGHDFSWDWPSVGKAVLQARRGKHLMWGADHTFWWQVE